MKRSFLLSSAILFSAFLCSAQKNTDPFTNRVIAKYYLPSELSWMKDNAPDKLERIRFYYIYSFYITPFSCSNCLPFYEELIDVTDYNRFRERSSRVTVTDSIHGYKITLYSEEELEAMIRTGVPFSENNSERIFSSSPVPTGFPQYFDNGDPAADLQNYLLQKDQWVNDHPEEYRLLLRTDSGIHFISAAEFMNLPPAKRQNILQNQDKYIIQND